MTGFKKPPIKLILYVFVLTNILIFLLYINSIQNEPDPIEIRNTTFTVDTIPPEVNSKLIHEVESGESLSVIFEEKNVPLNTAYKIFSYDKDGLLSDIRPGDIMEFHYHGNSLLKINIIKDDINSITINTIPDISIKRITKAIQNIESFHEGTISSSFYQDALNSGMPDSIIMDFAYIFGWDIDFIFDVRKGDKFLVIYETNYSDGEKVSNGDIIFAKFINNDTTYIAQRFYDDSQGKQYFNSFGENVKKSFLRAPVDFTRISDHFNPNRMHPILHTIRAHKGTDYAAPRGTPIQATGDGVISFIGVKGGCGNEILIKHANNYKTRYCHLDKFNKKMKRNKKVKQGDIIGYVGSSGLATGPHLHYEFMIGNKHTDPVNVKLPSALPLSQNQFQQFQNQLELNLAKIDLYNQKNNE